MINVFTLRGKKSSINKNYHILIGKVAVDNLLKNCGKVSVGYPQVLCLVSGPGQVHKKWNHSYFKFNQFHTKYYLASVI
jgi:hypothetical protein